jgi:hypothetical protein
MTCLSKEEIAKSKIYLWKIGGRWSRLRASVMVGRRSVQLKMQKVKFKIEGERATGGIDANCAKGSAVTDRRYSPDAKPSGPGRAGRGTRRQDLPGLSRIVPGGPALSHIRFFLGQVFLAKAAPADAGSYGVARRRKVREVRDSSPRLLRFPGAESGRCRTIKDDNGA